MSVSVKAIALIAALFAVVTVVLVVIILEPQVIGPDPRIAVADPAPSTPVVRFVVAAPLVRATQPAAPPPTAHADPAVPAAGGLTVPVPRPRPEISRVAQRAP